MQMKHKLLAVACAVTLAAGSAWAVPARRDVVHKMIQPDGTIIELTRIGDEHKHFFVTSDRLPVLADEAGRWCYATVDNAGRLVASAVAVGSPAERAFVASVDRVALSRAMNAKPSAKVRRVNQSTGIGLFDSRFPASGSPKAIVILVEYKDVKFKVTNPQQYYTDFLNKEGFSQHGGTGSVKDFYTKSSNGKFTPQFDVYGPVTLANNMSYYGGNDIAGNDKAPEKMVSEACAALDATVDFSQYDNDHNGYVDNVYIIYAGQGEASYGSASTVWPHSWTMQDASGSMPKCDGVYINDYGCSNEWEQDSPDGIGTYTHEFGHILGLPDLYCTDYGAAATKTPGMWSVMDYGSYNNGGRTPCSSSIYERNALGWIDPIVIDNACSLSLNNIHDSNEGAVILTSNKNEFFLFENRQQVGWDKYLPGHGMIVWHIDYNKTVFDNNKPNNTSSHQYIDIEEAGGVANNESETTMASYPFPGTKNVTSFTADTKPALRTWNNTAINLPITEIAETGGVISFNVDGGAAIELDAPQATASDIKGNGFTLSWNPVSMATSYTVDVYTRAEDGSVVPAMNAVTTDKTTVTVERLQPLTQYYATVTAKRGATASQPSAEVAVATTEATFDMLVPVARPAVNVTYNSFMARWNAVEGAVDYLLNVLVTPEGQQTSETMNFGTGNSLKFLTGWTSNTTDYYGSKSTGYFNDAAPALKMAKEGTYLLSPVYNSDIAGLKWWMKPAGNAPDNSIEVLGYDAAGNQIGQLGKFEGLDFINGAFAVLTQDKIPAGVRQVKLLFHKTSGNMAVDDLEITIGSGGREVSLEGYENRSVGNTLSATVSNLPSGLKSCRYTVTAVNAAGVKSQTSDAVDVASPTMGMTDTAVASDATIGTQPGAIVVSTDASNTVTVTDAMGRRIATVRGSSTIAVTPGFYIVSTPGTSVKVIVK